MQQTYDFTHVCGAEGGAFGSPMAVFSAKLWLSSLAVVAARREGGEEDAAVCRRLAAARPAMPAPMITILGFLATMFVSLLMDNWCKL